MKKNKLVKERHLRDSAISSPSDTQDSPHHVDIQDSKDWNDESSIYLHLKEQKKPKSKIYESLNLK